MTFYDLAMISGLEHLQLKVYKVLLLLSTSKGLHHNINDRPYITAFQIYFQISPNLLF